MVKWPPAAGPFLAAVKLEDRLLEAVGSRSSQTDDARIKRKSM
jgi:hypothetical protein